MRVLQVAPLWFGVGPDGPGGIETLLGALTRALRRAGCEVTLLAAGGSDAGVPTVEVAERGLFAQMEEGAAWDYVPYEQAELLAAMRAAADHDVVHAHVGPSGFTLSGAAPTLHTLHGQVTPDLEWLVGREPQLWLTTPGERQAARLRAAGARRCRTIPNGIATERFPFGPGGGAQLAFLGRMEAQKGPDVALDVAASLGADLVLAGPVADRAFFSSEIEPRLGARAAYAGVLGHGEKCSLLAESTCVLMPSRWDEPFGMVAVEAMACGTPVVALANGALPEIVEDGRTGFVTADPEELPSLVERAAGLDRAGVRSRTVTRFGIDAVAAAYIDAYRDVRAA